MARQNKLVAALTALLDEPADASFSRLRTWRFWRTSILYFCVFSVVGHLVEYPYCWIGMTFFDSVDPTSEVLTNPLKPFFVYGIGAVLCRIFLEPLRKALLEVRPPLGAAGVFYLLSVILGMCFELVQGFLQNQPDPVTGEYPLWDVSDYPGNILGQAWIVNDIGIGALITFVVWIVLPLAERISERLNDRAANLACLIAVIITLALTLITY